VDAKYRVSLLHEMNVVAPAVKAVKAIEAIPKKELHYLSLYTISRGENAVAQAISPALKKKLKCCNEIFWMCVATTNLWRIVRAPHAMVITHMQRLIDAGKERLMAEKKLVPDDDTEKLKEITSFEKKFAGAYREVGGSTFSNQVVKLLMTYLYEPNFTELLDNNIYQIAYTNGMLDLNTMQFDVGIMPTDYLTQTLPFGYEKGKPEDKQFVRGKLLQICNNNEEHLNYYLSMLGYAMTGDAEKEQDFWYLLGQTAQNGKSLVFESLEKIMPMYVGKGLSTVLDVNEELKKEVATWRGRRILWINELSSKKKNEELVKAICVGTNYKYNRNYAIEAEVMRITFKLIAISNNSLNIKGDEGVKRRFKQCLFRSQFKATTTAETENAAKLQFMRDKNLGSKLTGQYKHALLELIFEYSKNYADKGNEMEAYPEEWKESGEDAMDANNEFETWLDEHIVKCDPTGKVPMKLFKKVIPSEFKGENLKDTLVRMGVDYKYDSQEKHTVNNTTFPNDEHLVRVVNGVCKGWFSGFSFKFEDDDAEEEVIDEIVV
jgi:hypothetical protein